MGVLSTGSVPWAKEKNLEIPNPSPPPPKKNINVVFKDETALVREPKTNLDEKSPVTRSWITIERRLAGRVLLQSRASHGIGTPQEIPASSRTTIERFVI